MSLQKFTSTYLDKESTVYRFEYHGWEMIITIPEDKAIMHGIAINSEFEHAPVYQLTKRRRAIHIDNSAAIMVGELAKEIAMNYAHNMLDEHE